MSKPWDNEPTPLTDANAIEEYSPRLKLYADIEVSRNVERRMRAAERLLRRVEMNADIVDICAHLKAARKEDGR